MQTCDDRLWGTLEGLGVTVGENVSGIPDAQDPRLRRTDDLLLAQTLWIVMIGSVCGVDQVVGDFANSKMENPLPDFPANKV